MAPRASKQTALTAALCVLCLAGVAEGVVTGMIINGVTAAADSFSSDVQTVSANVATAINAAAEVPAVVAASAQSSLSQIGEAVSAPFKAYSDSSKAATEAFGNIFFLSGGDSGAEEASGGDYEDGGGDYEEAEMRQRFEKRRIRVRVPKHSVEPKLHEERQRVRKKVKATVQTGRRMLDIAV